MKQYLELAQHYDQWMANVDYKQWWAYLVAHGGLQPDMRILEVGCGTASLTLEMARQGYSGVASDVSEAMLVRAEQKLRQYRNIKLLQLDMRRLPTSLGTFNAVIASCDAVNYLTSEAHLSRFLTSARKALSPGGVLLFDTHGVGRQSAWRQSPYFNHAGEDSCYLCQMELDDANIRHYLTGFRKLPSGTWERFDEVHEQRFFTVDEVTEALAGAGFTVVEACDFLTNRTASDESMRVQFRATFPALSR